MKTCIICRNEKLEKEFNEEHIIPDSIGGTLKIHDVCKECNSNLGAKIDIHLTNNFLSELNRFFFKIKGKSGKIPNPFERGVIIEDGSPSEMVICDEELKPKLIGKVRETVTPDEYLIVAGNEEEVYELARKKLKRKLNKEFTDEEIKSMFKERETKVFQCKIKFPAKNINFNLIEMSIIKIAYEFAYYWLGTDYLNDLQSKIVASILFKTSRDISAKKQYNLIGVMPSVVKDNLSVERLSRKFNKSPKEIDLDAVHFVQLHRKGNKLYCNISLFGDFNYWVVVSQNAYKYLDIDKTFIALADSREYVYNGKWKK